MNKTNISKHLSSKTMSNIRVKTSSKILLHPLYLQPFPLETPGN